MTTLKLTAKVIEIAARLDDPDLTWEVLFKAADMQYSGRSGRTKEEWKLPLEQRIKLIHEWIVWENSLLEEPNY